MHILIAVDALDTLTHTFGISALFVAGFVYLFFYFFFAKFADGDSSHLISVQYVLK